MKIEIEGIADIDAKAGDIVANGPTFALICEDKNENYFYMVNLMNGSIWSSKYKDVTKLIRHYFKDSYEIYKSSEAKLTLKKEAR